jgi:hypothetical protein
VVAGAYEVVLEQDCVEELLACAEAAESEEDSEVAANPVMVIAVRVRHNQHGTIGQL